MGLLKTITQPQGYDVVFWRIVKIAMTFTEALDGDGNFQFSGKARVTWAGYTAEDWRAQGVEPAVTVHTSIPTPAFAQMIASNPGVYDDIQNELEVYAANEELPAPEGQDPEPGVLNGATQT